MAQDCQPASATHLNRMDSAFQVVAITDQPGANGESEAQVFAVRTRTSDEALALAKERLPATWTLSVTPGFFYAPAVVEGHAIGMNDMARMW